MDNQQRDERENPLRITTGGAGLGKTMQHWSLWQMLALHTQTFNALGFIASCVGEWRLWQQILANAHRVPIAAPDIQLNVRATFLASCERLANSAEQMGMRGAFTAARRAYDQGLQLLAAPIGYDHHRLGVLVGLGSQLLQVYADELEGQQLMTISPGLERFLAEVPQFGEQVEDAFPSTIYDIREAAMCLGCERWTAAVMHLMRVLEGGLSALAAHYQIMNDQNWNQVLNKIEAAVV